MSTTYPSLRLKIPSLSQGNEANADSQVWCGRTAGAMIYNYYLAVDAGGVDQARSEFIINQRDKNPHDLVYGGGPRAGTIAAADYVLLGPAQLLKKHGWKDPEKLFPLDHPLRKQVLDGTPLTETQVIECLDKVLRALDAFNPVLIWTGLSSSDGSSREVRHLVVLSGYRRDGDGSLWLHIDDPSSMGLDAKGDIRPLYLESVINNTKPIGIPDAIQVVAPDIKADDRPGHRYWLRAAVLFQPNLHSKDSTTDFWCDHADSKGFQVQYNLERTNAGAMVELLGDPRYPVDVVEKGEPALWDAVARSGDPYPLSSRRSWHDGIHIPETAGVTTGRKVYPMGPGRVVIAWFPERKAGQPDRGMVVMRHALDPAALTFVDARAAEPPEGAIWLHTLYANLAGGETGASSLLAPLKPKGAKPALVRQALAGTAKRLLTETGLVLTPVTEDGLKTTIAASDLVALDDAAGFAIPQTDTAVEKWIGAAPALLADNPHHAVRMRLETHASRLVGVELKGAPWILDGEEIKVKPGFTGTTGRLFLEIKGSGESRSFPEAKPGKQYVDVKVDATTTLRPVETFRSNKLDRALIEVREVVEVTDNQAVIDEWERLDNLYAEMRDKVCGTEYAILDEDEHAWQDFIKEPIGEMGVQRIEADGVQKFGVHVEMFAKENFTANAHAGGRWVALEELGQLDSGTKAFFEAQLDALLSTARARHSTGGRHTSDRSLVGPAGDAQPTSLLSLVADGSPITIGEWTEHCAVPEHARELSQVVAHHRSEWTLDLVEDETNKIPLEAIPAEFKTALFPATLDSPGLDTDTFHYFHPLRVVDWLRTGIDVSLHDIPEDKRDKVKLVLALGDTEIDLVPCGSDNHRVRLLLGDVAHAGEQHRDEEDDAEFVARGVLKLEGVATKHPDIEVELRRNRVVGLSLTEPGGHAHALREVGSGAFGTKFSSGGIMAAKGEWGIVNLLRDAGGPLGELTCGKATLMLDARYNLALPDRLAITVPAEFTLVSLEVTGAVADPPFTSPVTAASLSVRLASPPGAADGADELVTSAGTVSVRATLVPNANTAASGKVTIEISGGDLEKPVKGKFEIKQRDIPAGARGHDVAKLQVYLSQILCGAFGCLRSKDKSPVARVDGDYGEATSLALWRFLLFYCPWSGKAKTVATQKGDVTLDGSLLTADEIDPRAAELHKKHGGPTVTQEIVDVIVAHYRMPFVGLACSIGLGMPVMCLAVGEISERWPKWKDAQRSRVLPLAEAPPLKLNVRVKSVVPGNRESVQVNVVLEDGAAYRLVEPVPATLDALVARGLELAPSGELNPAKAKPRLVVKAASGGVIAAIDLGGATDVRAPGTEVGYDALMIQHYLRLRTNAKGKPYIAGKIDGNFADGSKKALDAFVADRHPTQAKVDYAHLLRWLQTGVSPVEEEAAQ